MNKSVQNKSSPAKPGRKSSGLRDLSPEAARMAISRAALAAFELGTEVEVQLPRAVGDVRAAIALQARVVKETGRLDGKPTLERLLRGDVAFERVQVAEDGAVTMQAVVRGDGDNVRARLHALGLKRELIWTAEQFCADVAGATIGKLTASYGEGRGGGTAGEPERVFARIQRITRALETLNRTERLVVWSILVFGVCLHDVGHATDGERLTRKEPQVNAATIRLEIALERMHPYYLANAGRG